MSRLKKNERDTLRAAAIVLKGTMSNAPVIPQPEPFKGDRDGPARTFLNQCDLYFLGKPKAHPRNLDKVRFALLLMKDRAAQWARPILERHMQFPDDRAGSHVRWREFKVALARNYIDPDLELKARLQLAKIRQTSSASDYTSRFNELIVDAGYRDDGAIWMLYYQGLKDNIKDALANFVASPPTFNDLCESAIHLDTRIFNREQ